MISTCRAITTGILRMTPKFRMNHIKDMREENARVRMEELQNQPVVAENGRVYKPTYTIEFNREGEVLLYSANPINSETLYFKYPYIFCTLALTQTSPSSPSPSSTTSSTPSTWSGTGPASGSTTPWRSPSPAFGTSPASSGTPCVCSSSEAAGSSKWSPRAPAEIDSPTGSRTIWCALSLSASRGSTTATRPTSSPKRVS